MNMLNASISTAYYTDLKPIENNHSSVYRMNGSGISDLDWDICYRYEYPCNVLCNLHPSHFVFDNIEANSFEGLLQSFKTSDPELQKKICKLPGFFAKKLGNYLKKQEGYDPNIMHWQGQKFKRQSKEYQDLLHRAYKSKYSADNEFKSVLAYSMGHRLTHKIGKSDPTDTILTEKEFIDNLETLRNSRQTAITPDVIYFRLKNCIAPNTNPYNVANNFKGIKTTVINDQFMCGESLFENGNNSFINKRNGITHIIDINAPKKDAMERAKLCSSKKIKYTNLLFNSDVSTAESIKSISKMIESMDKGYSYINCNDKHEANTALALNYLFNPDSYLSDALMFGTPRKKFIKSMRMLYEEACNSCPQDVKVSAETFKDRIEKLYTVNS